MRSPGLRSLGLLAALLSACDSPFPVASRVEGVRVLAVRSDSPLARPGETVNLAMLVTDGGAPVGAPRPLEVAWFGGCNNPAGDSYESCFPAFSWLRSLPADGLAPDAPVAALPAGASLGHGTDFSLRLPDDLLTSHINAGGLPDQGLSFVFFAACAGRLVPATSPTPRAGIPVECVDRATGALLSTDDFVAGYVTVRADAERRNANPVVTAFSLGGVTPTSTACTADADCATGEACAPTGVCLPLVAACHERNIDDCPEVPVSPVVDPASFELDDSSTLPGEATPPESVWATYLTTAGEMKSDSESVVDQSSGGRAPSDYAGRWRVEPGFSGVARVFVVVRDGRGGTTWLSQDALVR